MGGVLQSTAVMQTSSGILSAGYYKPHPLENQISMNVKGKSVIKDPEALMVEMCQLCTERIGYRSHSPKYLPSD
jgi:DNA-directed RNA polymerase subunit L